MSWIETPSPTKRLSATLPLETIEQLEQVLAFAKQAQPQATMDLLVQQIVSDALSAKTRTNTRELIKAYQAHVKRETKQARQARQAKQIKRASDAPAPEQEAPDAPPTERVRAEIAARREAARAQATGEKGSAP